MWPFVLLSFALVLYGWNPSHTFSVPGTIMAILQGLSRDGRDREEGGGRRRGDDKTHSQQSDLSSVNLGNLCFYSFSYTFETHSQCTRDSGVSFLGMKCSLVYHLFFFLVSVHSNIRIIITLLTAKISVQVFKK